MTKIVNDILGNSVGAKFVRADLHIHSFGENGSYDVTDQNMTPELIVEKAIENDLQIISITDHNMVGNVPPAIKYAGEKNLLVIPGIEISTTQGHLLIYFNDISLLNNFYGKLDFTDNKKFCTKGIVECLKIAEQYNGFGILAHIEVDAGFEKTIGKFNPQFEEIFKQENLLGLEITKKESYDYYTNRDNNSDRQKMIKIKRESINAGDEYDLAKIMSSDSHNLSNLGLNASGNKKLTRIKIDQLSFESVKIAFLSPTSRIRVEDLLPNNIPCFIGLKFDGGLLTEQTLRFSRNLTCIIGGRGTGKSTLLESLSVASGNVSNTRLIDSEVWSEKISLLYEDETGKQTLFQKTKGESLKNISDALEGITKAQIERYGQGETAETIQHSDKDPNELLKFLDSFIDIEALKYEDLEIRQELSDNLSEIERLSLDIKSKDETIRFRNSMSSKLDVLKKKKVGDIVTYQESLIKERGFRDDLINDLNNLVKKYKNIFDDRDVFKEVLSYEDSKIVVGKQEFSDVKKVVEVLEKIVDKHSDEIKNEFKIKIDEIKSHLNSWKAKESEIQDKIDVKKKELLDSGIPFDMVQINKLTNDHLYYVKKIKEIEQKEKLLTEFKKNRADLLKKRKDLKNRIFQERDAFARRMNQNLKDTVSDFYVTIKYRQGRFNSSFQDYIKQTMDYRTSQVSKSKIIADNFSPFEFINAVGTKNFNSFENLLDENSNKVFVKNDIEKIFTSFLENNNLLTIESLVFEDLPEIIVTRISRNTDGTTKTINRDFSKLSLGQQQSILLAILLHSKSNVPLLIDQPEDNLDSEFIFKTIVQNLRKIKEYRQVIIVTHNPNIAVLGDAEMIIPLKSTNDRTFIVKRGSIDNLETRKLTCDILEGGERAFLRRKEIYGF